MIIIIDSWNKELGTMNDGKKGGPYLYPDPFIRLLGYMRVCSQLLCRQTGGVDRVHVSKKVPNIPDYITANMRVNKLDIKINEHAGNDIVLILLVSRSQTKANGYVTNGMAEEAI